MSIPLEQPPEHIDDETKAWIDRMFIYIAGDLEDKQAVIDDLKKRVEELEKKVP